MRSIPVFTVQATLASGTALLFAYIDPGAAGFAIVSILGFLTAAGYTIRQHWRRIKCWVRGMLGKSPKVAKRQETAGGEPSNRREADG